MELPTTPSFRLDGRRAIVTGAGQGIGFGAAAALSGAGAQVTLIARGKDDIEAAARHIGNGSKAVQLDVLDIAAVRDFFSSQDPFHVLDE